MGHRSPTFCAVMGKIAALTFSEDISCVRGTKQVAQLLKILEFAGEEVLRFRFSSGNRHGNSSTRMGSNIPRFGSYTLL